MAADQSLLTDLVDRRDVRSEFAGGYLLLNEDQTVRRDADPGSNGYLVGLDWQKPLNNRIRLYNS